MTIGQLKARAMAGTGQRVVVSYNTENGYRHEAGYIIADTVDSILIHSTQGNDIKVKIEKIKAVTMA